MSENSSDSESSCGWTIINHEGSDIETLHSEAGEADLPSQHCAPFEEGLQPPSPVDLPDTGTDGDTLPPIENTLPVSEDHHLTTQDLPSVRSSTVSNYENTTCDSEEVISGDDGHCETVSDDSDIVTLDTPKPDVSRNQEEEDIAADVLENSELNMSFSSSSQYTFSQPETVYPSQHSADESSNDEASDDSGPILRRRRPKRSTVSGSESENRCDPDHPVLPELKPRVKTGNNLNKCIILALVIAISMGFGHFYGTVQILERQKYVEIIHENELNDMKDDLVQCQKEQDSTIDQKEVVDQLTENMEDREDLVLSLEGLMDKIAKENQMLKQKHTEIKLETNDLATSLKTTVRQNINLAHENQHLRDSLEKEEQALSSLKEELRKLREQIRNLEEKGRYETMQSENQKLKEHLKEERQKIRSFRTQKETLLTEAQYLRKELDNERQITDSLKMELEEISNRRSSSDSTHDAVKSNQEIEHLRSRLSELEKKLNFEQQRSDLWERLYIEAKEQNEKLDGGNSQAHQESDQSNKGKTKTNQKKRGKDTFFNSVKDTFDAMKNSTKEFVRHHKEKIKQAKEAVKENLKKFSDSVKTTFRHFKDSTRNMFDKNRYRKYAERRREDTKEAQTVRREYRPDTEKNYPSKAAFTHHKGSQGDHETQEFEDSSTHTLNDNEKIHKQKGCSGVFECAHQESISLFNKVLDPVRIEEFHDLMQVYLQEQVDDFRHWQELEQFINKFFHEGIFIHDQMLFTDFVNDVEDYLEDMKEYQTNTGGVFEDLDEFVYRHFFGNAYSTPYGPRKPEKIPPHKERKQEAHQEQYKREGKWNKHGRTNGRHMANFEIELGQLPFDPKY
ncbi:cell cycle progression protein 1 [Hyperolius riggenbachi]|uniref:cell cycle progression protein 1 n=1 Tax=Hyperolius riggenbachi TaxID=752182 RepID=UPI0035A2C2C6